MYRPNISLFYKTGIAIMIAVLFKLLFFRPEEFFEIDLLHIVVIVLIIWLGNLQIDKWLNIKYKWVENPQKRLLIQSFLCTIFTITTLFVLMYLLHQHKFHDGVLINRRMKETFIPAVFLTNAVLAIHISQQFFKALKNSLLEVEKYKTESTLAQLNSLKNQLNPHFLFNNLSVLSALVYKNQDKAVDFINELSKVYRYVLENRNTELVTLEEELVFLAHYIHLLKIRFENGISFHFQIDGVSKSNYLLPMCLQLLVENAIQHNEISQARPLSISIYTDGHTIIVENAIQLRNELIESSKIGLKNIQMRYSFFTDEEVKILDDGDSFKVILPLISKK